MPATARPWTSQARIALIPCAVLVGLPCTIYYGLSAAARGARHGWLTWWHSFRRVVL